jgi:hypothetical protein
MSIGYGQSCPTSKASEVFAMRWTPLILRKPMSGPHAFNEIHHGAPLIFSAALVARLSESEAHRGWLADQSIAHPARQIVLDESIEAARLGEPPQDRVEGHLQTQIPTLSLFPLVQSLRALRGLGMIGGAGVAAAIGDPSRFASAPDFMAYLGMVPSEHSTGPKRRVGAISKAGDIQARTLLIEAAHSYRFPARVARHKLAAIDAVPEAVRAIARKAQTWLCQRYRHMMAKGKPRQVVPAAIAPELAGLVWSRAHITPDPAVKNSAVTTASDEVCPTAAVARVPHRRPSKGNGRPLGSKPDKALLIDII